MYRHISRSLISRSLSLSTRTVSPPTLTLLYYPFVLTTAGVSSEKSRPLLHSQLRHNQGQAFIPAFINSIKRQIKENQDLQKNVKQLSADTSQLMESDAMQSAKKAMESGTKAAKRVGEAVQAVVDNPAVKKTVEVVGDGIGKVGEVVGKVAEPILETEAAKKIAEGVRQIDESVSDLKANSRYVEYRTKADRQRLKEKRLAQLGHPQNRAVSANLEAGGSVVIHKQSRWAETWKEFTENSPIAKSMFSIKRGIEETDSPLMERIREIFASPVFQETEQSRVVRAFRSVDPSFNLEDFTTEIAEFVVPDIMEAYLSGDAVTLEEWCSERAYAQLTRGFEVQTQHGLISDCKLLDIRQLQLAKAMVIEDGTMGTDVPVLTYRFTTQEVLLFRNVKGEVALGKEDNIVSSGWVIVFTKDQCIDPTIPVNPNTNGWRVLEAAKMDSW